MSHSCPFVHSHQSVQCWKTQFLALLFLALHDSHILHTKDMCSSARDFLPLCTSATRCFFHYSSCFISYTVIYVYPLLFLYNWVPSYLRHSSSNTFCFVLNCLFMRLSKYKILYVCVHKCLFMLLPLNYKSSWKHLENYYFYIYFKSAQEHSSKVHGIYKAEDISYE